MIVQWVDLAGFIHCVSTLPRGVCLSRAAYFGLGMAYLAGGLGSRLSLLAGGGEGLSQWAEGRQ